MDGDNKEWKYQIGLYENYQYVAYDWDKTCANLSEHSGGIPSAPQGPGDEMLPIIPDENPS